MKVGKNTSNIAGIQ